MEVELRDESWVGIRAIEAGDKDALLTGFNRLSDESRYKRFLTPMETLAPSQLAYLTEVDHRDHEALVALDLAAGDWPGLGLGTALTRVLAGRAVKEGISRFTALLLAG